MLLFGAHVTKVVNGIRGSAAAQYAGSAINLLLGLAIISSYNEWRADPLIFITLLGWALFIRGVLGLYMPRFITNTILSAKWTKLFGLLPFIWGLILIWLGFYVLQ